MTAYATATDFEAYVEGWVTDNAAALDRLLERASRDVDAVMGPRDVITTGTFAGFKFDPSTLQPWEAKALARATCAQAEHRFTVTEPVLRGEPLALQRRASVKGPDFEETYTTAVAPGAGVSGRYSPKLGAELAPIKHLRAWRARTRI